MVVGELRGREVVLLGRGFPRFEGDRGVGRGFPSFEEMLIVVTFIRGLISLYSSCLFRTYNDIR